MTNTTTPTQPLDDLHAIVAHLDVPTTMPEYGRLWLRLDQRAWAICGDDQAAYQAARNRLHRLFTDKALARCPDAPTRAATVAAGVNMGMGFPAVHLATEVVS